VSIGRIDSQGRTKARTEHPEGTFVVINGCWGVRVVSGTLKDNFTTLIHSGLSGDLKGSDTTTTTGHSGRQLGSRGRYRTLKVREGIFQDGLNEPEVIISLGKEISSGWIVDIKVFNVRGGLQGHGLKLLKV
jgi:hypothetical protein